MEPLNPLLTAGVYFLIFGVVLNASRGIDNYAFWLVIGLFAFRLTQTSVTQGAVSVTSRQGMVRSIRFPRILLPVASTIGALIGFAFEVGILIVFAFATGEGLTWRILFLPRGDCSSHVVQLRLCSHCGPVQRLFRRCSEVAPICIPTFALPLWRHGSTRTIRRSWSENYSLSSVVQPFGLDPRFLQVDLHGAGRRNADSRHRFNDLSDQCLRSSWPEILCNGGTSLWEALS